MESDSQTVETKQPKKPVRWKAAVLAGLLAGGIFLIFSRGIPWFSSGLVAPTVMGRDVHPSSNATPGLNAAVALIHIILSIIYALMMAPIINRLSIGKAVFAGSLMGLGLYFLNLFVYMQFFPRYGGTQEIAPVLTHVVFGMIAAAAYKGMAKRKVQPE